MSINSLIPVTQGNKYLCRTFSAEENVLLLSLSILPTGLIYTFYVFIFQVYDSAVTKWRDLQTLYTAMCVGISASVSFFLLARPQNATILVFFSIILTQCTHNLSILFIFYITNRYEPT